MNAKNSFLKKIITIVWLGLIVFCLGCYCTHAEQFTVDKITIFLQQFSNQIITVYLIVSITRGFTLIPSTPFVLAVLLFCRSNLYWLYSFLY